VFGCHRSSHTPLLRGAQSIAFIRLSANTSFRIGSYRLIDQERLEAVRTEHHIPDYSVEQRVRAVGGVHIYLPIVTVILATIFGVVGILVWMSTPETNSSITSARHDKGEPSDAHESPS
ncbi:hypothetical protein, partial [Rhodopirellula halodulae]|uniref:hypothetical protein n=1 Tax=Rhodopirellula halodulae TaxID=2894198 RepID=UPI001E4A7372